MSDLVEGFSIIVPTHGRPDLVAELLPSLRLARTHLGVGSEIILVDSSDGEAGALIKALCQQYDARYMRGENHVGLKRNLGLAASAHDKVFFIDSDCRADPDVLREHLAAHVKEAGSKVGGVLGLTEWHGAAGPVWKVLELHSSMTAAFRFAAWFKDVPWGTCTNISFRREPLLAVGGFDEQFPLPVYGEDVDLGLRLGKAGYRLVTNPRAVVSHNRVGLNSFRVAWRKSVNTGRADYHLGNRHMERLMLEYPGPLSVALLLGVFGVSLAIARHTILGPLLPVAYLLFYIGLAALLATRQRHLGWVKALPLCGVGLLELAFEAGRLFEAVRHGSVRRLWTKFVYVEAQLLAERERRIVQAWSMLISLLFLLLLLQV